MLVSRPYGITVCILWADAQFEIQIVLHTFSKKLYTRYLNTLRIATPETCEGHATEDMQLVIISPITKFDLCVLGNAWLVEQCYFTV